MEYDHYLRRRGRAASTRRQYSFPLRSFSTWIKDRSVGELTTADLESFLSSWEEQFEASRGRPPRLATLRGTIGALRGFFEYLEISGRLIDGTGTIKPNPMRKIFAPPHQQRPNDYLRPHEDEALLTCDCSPTAQTVIWLLRWTGLRVSEAVDLRLEDITLTPGDENLVVRASKTPAGRRTVPVVPDLVPILDARIRELTRVGVTSFNAPVLRTRNGTPMERSYIWRLVKRIAAQAGVRVVPCTCGSPRTTYHEPGCPRTVSGENRSRVSPHTLRRTFGSDLINRGLRLEVVSKLLGHATTTVTERAYAELLGNTIRNEMLEALTRRSPALGTYGFGVRAVPLWPTPNSPGTTELRSGVSPCTGLGRSGPA